MKKIAFIILSASLIILGCSKTDDFPVGNDDEIQLKSADTRTMVTKDYVTHAEFPLTCDGVEIEWLEGELTYHFIDHFIDGEMVWTIYTAKGTITGSSGETFRINESGKFDKSKKGAYLFHSNLRGDEGSHYILSGSVEFIDEYPWYEITFDKAMCVPNK